MKLRQTQTQANYQLPEPGELNQRVTIRQRIDIPAADFGTEKTFQGERPVWAKIRQVGSATYRDSVQAGEIVTHYIFIRYRAGITSDFEIVHGDTVYRISRIRDLNSARRFLMLECRDLGENVYTENIYG
ncbi:phage head closure protein [Dickeya solani]|uniref:Phage head closure protein n=1 Tax=Dickeya solani TaxID=1089444 RepID=A0ABU4EKR8_9GAMM|nr:phage head closure protein [Dickeya solani]MCZ0823707.1 phage head closure protein [Dickeya solani]MDV6995614.1 phage head closure protein [Dickeya solani]MDV7002893.1 phage head closure protein [Dickeya solani]MDV7036669.1 phage head closure protein [Dickeya solani]MDV7043422.1 phage head closure protein [Dickeya solani]